MAAFGYIKKDYVMDVFSCQKDFPSDFLGTLRMFFFVKDLLGRTLVLSEYVHKFSPAG